MTEARKNRLLLIVCFLVYSISYIGKYSYSTNIQNVISEFGVKKASAGYVTSAFFFCYGIGQLVNGILCERLNSKWTITLSLCLSAGITVAMFFLKNILAMAVLWGINGLILSVLWSHCIKILAGIEDKTYVAKSVMLMSFTLPVGVVFSYGCSAFFTYVNAWKLTYLVSAALLLGIGLFFFFSLESVNKTTETQKEEAKTVKEPPQKNIVQLFGWLSLPLFLIAVGTGLIRDGSSTWLPVLLSDTFALPDSFSILLTLGLPLMGIFAAKIATSLMDKVKNFFGACIFSGIIMVSLLTVLLFTFDTSFVLLVVLFMFLSLAGYILGNLLTSVLPLYYKGQIKSGQAAGLINASVYLGSTFSSLFLGSIVDDHGWQAFIFVLLVFSIILVVMSIFGVIKRRSESKK